MEEMAGADSCFNRCNLAQTCEPAKQPRLVGRLRQQNRASETAGLAIRGRARMLLATIGDAEIGKRAVGKHIGDRLNFAGNSGGCPVAKTDRQEDHRAEDAQ